MMTRLGVVIFGATGFTGKFAVLDMVRLSKKHPGVTWGVAGRSQSKLESLMIDVAKKTGEDLSNIKIIIADVSDESSLRAMCSQAQVVANCCGPYRLYGEPVVRAAIAAGAHHVDITGEPQFIETMQLKYDAEAREAGVYVISACGYDSIPNDLGTIYLQHQFGGTLNSVESYMSSAMPSQYWKQAIKQGLIHYGTWESLVYGLANYHELKPLRMKLYPEKLPTFEPKLQKRVSFLRQLLLDYPRIFSLGIVSHEGPSEVVMENTKYKVELYGEGWGEGTDVKQKPNKQVLVKVSGRNPGYGATVSALLYSAITILEESDKIPGKGGVLTTGYAFRDTSIIQHLSNDIENNMKFEVVSTSDI